MHCISYKNKCYFIQMKINVSIQYRSNHIKWTEIPVLWSLTPHSNTLTRKGRKSWACNNWRALLKMHKSGSLHKPCSLLCPVVSEFHVQFKEKEIRWRFPCPVPHTINRINSHHMFYIGKAIRIYRRGGKWEKQISFSFPPSHME